jgi:pimeloyl-ACP methyl ester carboxylesterase
MVLLLLSGGAGMSNPAFPLSHGDAESVLNGMARSPNPPQRPIVVLAGLYDPGIISRDIVRRLRRVFTANAPIISTSFFWSFTFDSCRDKVLQLVQQRFPNDDPAQTVPVDVIGFSMGGLIARYAAMPRDGQRQLAINRLYTIGTPHRGARMAWLAPMDPRAKDMDFGSDFLNSLDEDLARAAYDIVPYVRLDDMVVGEWNAAPAGIEPWWVPNKPLSLSHNMAGADARILADIARRLRDETPLTASRQP